MQKLSDRGTHDKQNCLFMSLELRDNRGVFRCSVSIGAFFGG